MQISKEIAVKYIDDIEDLLTQIKTRDIPDDEIDRLEVEFFHMKGRYLIREGEYENGVKYIKRVIKNSLKAKDYKYALKGYIQMIFYSIQTHNVEFMAKKLQPALALAKLHNYRKEVATLLRLKGLNMIMAGRYSEAESMLKESIKIFSQLDKEKGKYSLCIAAAYNYMGDIRRYNMNFQDAIIYYDKAIEISKKKKAFSSLAIFNTNAGHAAFEKGDYSTARNYLREATDMYYKFDTLWGRSTAEGYSALLFVKDKKYHQARKCLENADRYARKLKSPYEMGLVYRIKAEIKASIKKHKELNHFFSGYLDLPVSDYCDKGIQLLKNIKECYEIDILIDLKSKAEGKSLSTA